MNEITKKLRDQGLTKTEPLIIQLAKEGVDQKRIVGVIKSHIDSKINAYYAQAKEPQRLGVSLDSAIGKLNADSKAEVILYNLLIENHIEFEFQYPIGRYRVDFLVWGFRVVEIDGPQHNKGKDEIRDRYIRKMGYEMVRVPIFLLALDQRAVIEAIKETT